jgi:hypothetical protein
MATLLHALNDQGQWVPVNLRDRNEVGVTNEVEIKNASGEPIPVSHGLKIPEHDRITPVPATPPKSGNQVITYRKDGLVVAVVTVTYTNGDVSDVVRS